MDDKTTPLIDSKNARMIGTRFMVKMSIFDNGVHPKSILIAVQDLKDKGFSMKYFSDDDKAGDFLKLLIAAVK